MSAFKGPRDRDKAGSRSLPREFVQPRICQDVPLSTPTSFLWTASRRLWRLNRFAHSPCHIGIAVLTHVLHFLPPIPSPGYIGEFEVIDDHRSGKIVIQLLGRVNKAGCISPRYNVPLNKLEGLVSQLLPARSFGFVVLTTSAGIMDHEEARRKHAGGRILGYYCTFHIPCTARAAS